MEIFRITLMYTTPDGSLLELVGTLFFIFVLTDITGLIGKCWSSKKLL